MGPLCKAFLMVVPPERQANLEYLFTDFHLTLVVLTTEPLVLLSLLLCKANINAFK